MLSVKSLLKWILLVQTVSHVFTIEVTLSPDYNPLEMPDTDGKPLEIECFFRIDKMTKVDDSQQAIELLVTITFKWLDNRINVTDLEEATEAELNSFTSLPGEVWMPVAEIMNALDIDDVTLVMTKEKLRLLPGETKLFHRRRILVRISCMMTFERFPFDSHSCPFQMGIFNFDVSRLVTKTMGKLDFPIPSVVQYETNVSPLNPDQRKLETGGVGVNTTFSLAGFNVNLSRRGGPYLTSIYLPSAIFLVPPDSYPGRLGLLITTFLVLINIFMSTIHTVPMSGGINDMELWLLSCIMFVFLALLIYAVILFLRCVDAGKGRMREIKAAEFSGGEKGPGGRHFLDKIAIILVPPSFGIFVFSYVAKFGAHRQ